MAPLRVTGKSKICSRTRCREEEKVVRFRNGTAALVPVSISAYNEAVTSHGRQ